MNAQHRALIGARRRAGPAAVLGTLSSVALEQSQPSAEAAPAAAEARAAEARGAEARAAAATAAASAAVTTQTGPEATVRVDPPPVLPLRLSGGDAVAAPAAVPRAVPVSATSRLSSRSLPVGAVPCAVPLRVRWRRGGVGRQERRCRRRCLLRVVRGPRDGGDGRGPDGVQRVGLLRRREGVRQQARPLLAQAHAGPVAARPRVAHVDGGRDPPARQDAPLDFRRHSLDSPTTSPRQVP